VSCGFFRDGWPVGGFWLPLPGAGFAFGVAGLAEPAGLAAAGFAVVAGLPDVTDLAEVSLLTGDDLAGATGAVGAVPPVADAAPGTVGYRLNSMYC